MTPERNSIKSNSEKKRKEKKQEESVLFVGEACDVECDVECERESVACVLCGSGVGETALHCRACIESKWHSLSKVA